MEGFRPEESYARLLDENDPLASFRDRFHLPRGDDGRPLVYFTGNSLGLQPVGTAEVVNRELGDWARLGVEGHFEAASPWYRYHEQFRAPMGRLVGAFDDELVLMNSLTVNLHLMMVSFYRPTRERHKILIETCAFPSDIYAARSQIEHHGFDADEGLLVASGPADEGPVPIDEIERLLEEHGGEIALVLLPGVNYFTGQVFDMKRIAAAARARGCAVGFDLAHAVGNVPLQLHDWGCDFAVWCSYKYLNAGPGAVAGCFVHRRHAGTVGLGRFAGWWGNDPEVRFRMHLEPRFQARPTADGWQLSNPSVLAMAPLAPALALFEEAGMDRLRAKSTALTAYLQAWLDRIGEHRIQVLTPREADARGSQISMRAVDRPRELFRDLRAAGVVADFREPDVVRVAPVPLYNSYHDVWRLGRLLETWSEAGGARR